MENDKPSQPPNVRWVNPEKGTLRFYCNFTDASWTPNDVSITIGQIVPHVAADGKGLEVEEQATVTMTWAALKNLRDMAGTIIAAYERANCEIKNPNMATLDPSPAAPGTGSKVN